MQSATLTKMALKGEVARLGARCFNGKAGSNEDRCHVRAAESLRELWEGGWWDETLTTWLSRSAPHQACINKAHR